MIVNLALHISSQAALLVIAGMVLGGSIIQDVLARHIRELDEILDKVMDANRRNAESIMNLLDDLRAHGADVEMIDGEIEAREVLERHNPKKEKQVN